MTSWHSNLPYLTKGCSHAVSTSATPYGPNHDPVWSPFLSLTLLFFFSVVLYYYVQYNLNFESYLLWCAFLTACKIWWGISVIWLSVMRYSAFSVSSSQTWKGDRKSVFVFFTIFQSSVRAIIVFVNFDQCSAGLFKDRACLIYLHWERRKK